MRILLITLDLAVTAGAGASAPEPDKVFETIKSQGQWWHYLKSTWLVYTSKTVQEVAEALRPHVSARGLVLVTELRRPYQGWLPKEAWEWINTRVSQ